MKSVKLIKDRKVLIATSFRDFIGNNNDEVQYLFLDSIKNQTYRNWDLAVTVFNEKNVEEALRKKGLPFTILNSKSDNYRYSHTDVLLNAIKLLSRQDESILLWTTSDVLYEPNFFETVNKNFTDGFACTSHPHFIAKSLEEHHKNNYVAAPLVSGFDLIFFDANLFSRPENVALIENYRNINWGIFEHFLTGFSQLVASERINVWNESKVRKILNDREASDDQRQFIESSWSRNYEVLKVFIEDHGLSHRLLDLYYCHCQYSRSFDVEYLRNYFAEHVKRKYGHLTKQFKTAFWAARKKAVNICFPKSTTKGTGL